MMLQLYYIRRTVISKLLILSFSEIKLDYSFTVMYYIINLLHIIIDNYHMMCKILFSDHMCIDTKVG